MASSETGTIKLIKYIGSDKPTYLVDHNDNMDTIDNEVAALRAADENLSAAIAQKLTIPTGTVAQVLNGQGEAVGITDDVTLDSPISAMFFKIAHPLWDIIETTDPRNPGSYFQTTASYADAYEDGACGTWEKYAKGRTLVGEGTSDQAFSITVNNGQGGESNTSLDSSQLAAHTHNTVVLLGGGTGPCNGVHIFNGIMGGPSYAENTSTVAGSGVPHNNLQPYQVVYIWRRTA